jgi:hypothetical protein
VPRGGHEPITPSSSRMKFACPTDGPIDPCFSGPVTGPLSDRGLCPPSPGGGPGAAGARGARARRLSGHLLRPALTQRVRQIKYPGIPLIPPCERPSPTS